MARRIPSFTAALALAAVAQPSLASPVTVSAGDVNDVIGLYGGTGTPTYSVLNSTIDSGVGSGGEVVGFIQFALTTNLNPYAGGETFAFATITSTDVAPLSLTVSGYAGYATQVEACDPITLTSNSGCGPSAGTVSRSQSGDTLTFAGIPETPGGIEVYNGYVSDVYAIFTNASTYADPQACITTAASATPVCFSAANGQPVFGPSGSTVGGGGGNPVPEPGTLALLGLGGLGLVAVRRRRP